MPGLTLTLADHTVAYNLLELIQAVSGYDQTKPSCREVQITGDKGNSSGFIYKGGSDVTATNYGYRLATDAYRVHRSDVNDVSLSDIWLIASGDSLKVNIDWMYC